MIRFLLILNFLTSTCAIIHSQNCVDLNFAECATAPFNPATCKYTVGGIQMKLYWWDAVQHCGTIGNQEVIWAYIKRTDLPLNQGPGVLQIQTKTGGCAPVDIAVWFSDGSIISYGEFAEIDESNTTIDSIFIGESECGLNNVEVSFKKTTESATLLEPQNEQTERDTALFLTWAPVSNTSSYYLQVDTADQFNEPIYKTSITGTQKWVSGLEKNRTYYWRVGLPNGSCQDTIWSEIWEFTTGIEVILYNHHVEVPSDHFVDSLKLTNLDFTYLVVADGTYTLSLKRNRGKFSIRNGNSAEDFGILTDSLISPGVWITRYTAPSAYKGNKILLDFKHDDLHSEDFTLELFTLPVPVIMLHGLSSNGLMWGTVRSSLEQNGWNNTLLSSPSYQNDISYETTSANLDGYISELINHIRQDAIFVNKVSLVGHSMGGLLARRYLQHNPNTLNVSRLISINTPHAGSELANFIADFDLDKAGNWLAERLTMSNNGSGFFNVNNGAINSLRVNSSETLSLNNTSDAKIPVHAITSKFELCDFILDVPNSADPDNFRLTKLLSRILKATNAFIQIAQFAAAVACATDQYYLGPDNDGVVRLESQEGGLSSSSISHYSGVVGTFHTTITQNNEVTTDKLPQLLKANPEGANFNQTGFGSVVLPPPFSPSTPISATSRQDSMVEIEITNLQNFDTISALTNPKINITGNSFVGGLIIAYFYDNDSLILDANYSSSYTFSIPVLANYEGNIHIGVMGSDGYGNVDFDTMVVFLKNGILPTTTIENEGESIFPNPVKGVVELSLQHAPIERVELIDQIGRRCLVVEPNLQAVSIDVSGFTPGLYFLYITAGAKTILRRVVIL